ncbi:MAG TPA: amidase [bacterium]|nr:amidase [bacterium]
MNDPLFATIGELHAALRRRRISSVELTRLALDRLSTVGRRYNAVARVLPEHALGEARNADRLLRRGRGAGPLTGIPYGAKDLVTLRGVPTTWGAKPYARQVFDYDAAVIVSLREAGAVLAAKLAMIELAGGGGYRYPSASLTGPARNPWNRDHWTGGSSSGTGAAVGGGMVPFGIGSETSGSILSPSSGCNVTGLRPSYGLVSRYGAMALSWTMDKLGPMCRSAEDCGLVLEAIAGADPRDPGTAGRGFRMNRRPRKPSELRVGYAPVDFEETAQPSLRAALNDALRAFRGLGVKLRQVELPPLPIDSVARIIIRAEGSTVFQDLVESGRVWELADRRQAIGLVAGLEVSARDYLNAMRVRRLLQEGFARLFGEVDVILAPSRPAPSPRIDEPIDPEWRPARAGKRATRRGSAFPPAKGNAALTAAGNLAGLPGLSVPCGFSASDLPAAVQLVGRPFDDATVIDLGRAFQQATDWHRRRPPMPAPRARA